MKTPVNAQTLKHHFAYSWWMYLLVLLAGIFLVDLLFTVTARRVPEDKKVDFYVYGYVNSEALEGYLNQVREKEMPDMESVAYNLLFPEDAYGPMQLTTYIAVREGDLYLLPREQFLSLAANGAFEPLESDTELMAYFNEAGSDLRRGWRTLSESGETHLYGIPAGFLPGLSSMCYAEDGFLAILSYGGNTENTRKLLHILCRDLMQPAEEN